MKKMDLFKIGMYIGMGATVGKFFGDIINAALEGFIEGTIEGITEAKYKHKTPKEVVENIKKSYDDEEEESNDAE